MPNTGPNPISEYISYDNFGWSLLTSLQLVTMDYWESIYNSVSRVLVNCLKITHNSAISASPAYDVGIL